MAALENVTVIADDFKSGIAKKIATVKQWNMKLTKQKI